MAAPRTIYLQFDKTENLDLYDDEATWCKDKINDGDVEYIRKDVYDKLFKYAAKDRKTLEAIQDAIDDHLEKITNNCIDT